MDKCFYYAPDYNLDRFEEAQDQDSRLFGVLQVKLSIEKIFNWKEFEIKGGSLHTSIKDILNPNKGFIAANHFNAKVSSISFKGTFYLMSARLGDHFILLSTTLALNRIRRDEEFEKGWKKGALSLPIEVNELDFVHVIPLKRLKITSPKIIFSSYLGLKVPRFRFFSNLGT